MRITFARHGQSIANAGLPTDLPDDIPLTDLGQLQARELAASWTTAPDLLVTSPFLRARQTAQPTLDRFPHLSLEIWPIQEFTYLDPHNWIGSTPAQRRPTVQAYWSTNDPYYSDGPFCESIVTLLSRADSALQRIKALASKHQFIVLFSHSQFMHAIAIQALEPQFSPAEKMRLISAGGSGARFRNCQTLELQLINGRWGAVLEA